MKTYECCIVMHESDGKTVTLPHFDEMGYLHLTSFSAQKEQVWECIDEWVDKDPSPRCAYIAKHMGEEISQMCALDVTLPRHDLNHIKSKGVVMSDGTLAARYVVYMPRKGVFQDPTIINGWSGLLSLVEPFRIDPWYFDLTDAILQMWENWEEGKPEPVIEVVIDKKAIAPQPAVRLNDLDHVNPCRHVYDGEIISKADMIASMWTEESYVEKYARLGQMIDTIQGPSVVQRWSVLAQWLADGRERADRTFFRQSAEMWYGLEKYNRIVELFERTNFVAKIHEQD